MEVVLPRTFSYDPQWRHIGFLGVLSLGSLLLAYVRWWPLSLAGWITLIFGGMSLVLVVRRTMFKRFLELGTATFSVPHGFLRLRPREIAYAEIVGVWQSALPLTAVLHVATATTKAEIFSMMLADAETYIALRSFFLERKWERQSSGA
jgi:hypothetical protein